MFIFDDSKQNRSMVQEEVKIPDGYNKTVERMRHANVERKKQQLAKEKYLKNTIKNL